MDVFGNEGSHGVEGEPKLDLSSLPPIYVSTTHLETDDLRQLEEELLEVHANLTYDLNEAQLILSKVTKKGRIKFDLRTKDLHTEEVSDRSDLVNVTSASPAQETKAKRQRTSTPRNLALGKSAGDLQDDSSTASESGRDRAKVQDGLHENRETQSGAGPGKAPSQEPTQTAKIVKVIDLKWFGDCKAAGRIFPIDGYINYVGQRVDKPATPKVSTVPLPVSSTTKQSSPSKAILERAKEDAPPTDHSRRDRFGKRKFNVMSKSTAGASWEAGHGSRDLPRLHPTTTSDQEGSASDMPEMPEWVKKGVKYACQRSTPRYSPNEDFIDMLKKIKLARLLTNDEIGVRAYSTSIASLAAYPHHLSNPREILALPGCENKIANLFVEWKNTGKLKAVEDIDANGDLKILKLFYEIWGVGATTAREFYYERGWHDLDDIVEYGWSTLSRVQQIGVKYYEEFLDRIPKAEVENIGRIIHEHAAKVMDDQVQTLIVGGYRRGKEASGDVDIIVSHPNEDLTLNVVSEIVASLEDDGWVTHTLLLSLNNTNRGQQTLPFRTGGGGHGFDTLDKALVVWQDPQWSTKDADLAADPKAKNPNIHRRVDIIVSPWRTVGCAVTGWSGGTTFQRDVRRYAKYVKGWKFDSSGVRSRVNGEVVDLEGWTGYHGKIGTGRAKTMLEAERRVFEGLGLVYREPWERCTG